MTFKPPSMPGDVWVPAKSAQELLRQGGYPYGPDKMRRMGDKGIFETKRDPSSNERLYSVVSMFKWLKERERLKTQKAVKDRKSMDEREAKERAS